MSLSLLSWFVSEFLPYKICLFFLPCFSFCFACLPACVSFFCLSLCLSVCPLSPSLPACWPVYLFTLSLFVFFLFSCCLYFCSVWLSGSPASLPTFFLPHLYLVIFVPESAERPPKATGKKMILSCIHYFSLGALVFQFSQKSLAKPSASVSVG